MKIMLTLSYDGTAYCGWQTQKNGLSIQQVLEETLEKITGEKIKVTGSGRTDAGVHAKGQTASFETNCTIPPEKYFKALNSPLPLALKHLKSFSPKNKSKHSCISEISGVFSKNNAYLSSSGFSVSPR